MTRTKRRWIVSVLDAAATAAEPQAGRRTNKPHAADQTQLATSQKGFASRLLVATRPLRDAAR